MNRMVRAAAVAALLQVIPTLAQPVLPPMPTNSVPETQEQRDARTAAIEAARQAVYQADFAAWIVGDERGPQGEVATPQAMETQRQEKLAQLSQDLIAVNQADGSAVAEFVRTNVLGLPQSWIDESGSLHIIDHVVDGFPYIKSSWNLGAAASVGATNLWPGGTTGYGLTGANVDIGIWDQGHVMTNHQEFVAGGARVQIMDTNRPTLDDHATHVADTLAAWGTNGGAKGFSHRGRILSSDFQLDFSEMANSAGTNALRISNHSYGYDFGWYNLGTNLGWAWYGDEAYSTSEDYHFGFYDGIAMTNDRVIYAAKTLLPVFAAGNENWEGPLQQPVVHWARFNGSWYQSVTVRPLDGGVEGYHTLNGYAVSKNNLVVGAVAKIPGGYTNPSSVQLAWFSSTGPTDDGRIKPDLVAPGINLYSSTFTNTTSYGYKSGTSMAAPSVTGALGLLLELHQRNYGTNQPPLASTLKGLVINTADEAGPANGPDYFFGWGLLNALRAAQLMSNNVQSGSLAHMKEVRLTPGDYIEFPILATYNQPLRATVCWTDPAGTSPAWALNPTNLMLVNDLDLRLIAPNGTTNFPWVLNPAARTNAATTGDNFRDNVERVDVGTPQNGLYRVRVTSKRTLLNDQGMPADQRLSIVVSGNLAQAPTAPYIISSAMVSSNTFALKWNSEVGRVYQIAYRENVASGDWLDASGEISATKTTTASTVVTPGTARFYRVVQIR